MTRPRKATVDYFPHYVNHGKTIFILRQRFGNDGYAFWFTLLELLGKSEGHYLNLVLPEETEFLAAQTYVSPGKTEEILSLLATLNAIDPILWKKRIIWCQNFVDYLKPVYNDRSTNLPEKPCFPTGNHISPPENQGKPEFSLPEIPKVKESKVKESTPPKKSNKKTFIPDNFTISDNIRQWANKEGFEPFLKAHLDYFIDYAKAGGIQTVDWDAKFRNAIRADWGDVRKKLILKQPDITKPKRCINHSDRQATIFFMGQNLCAECHKIHLDLRNKTKPQEAVI